MIDENRITLEKEGVIVFLGSMNAMPMMYAWELKKLGYNVLYFVDVAKVNTLSRPENHFPDIKYPYPDWVIESIIPSQILLPIFRANSAEFYFKKIKKITNRKINCIVLNGFFISLSSYFSRHARTVALSHGSDLDVWANKESSKRLGESFSQRSIFKYLPLFLSRRLIQKIVERQYDGLVDADAVVYFPEKFNDAGDFVLNSLRLKGKKILSRYDISFAPLDGLSREFKIRHEKIVIFSGVRFLYKTFPDGNEGYSKGNDIIIRGLAKYYADQKNIEIHFVEKGEDVTFAKELCRQLGLDEVVIWHKEMSFRNLIKLFINSDICFDQVGAHWIGAIGAYALYIGKPLIANINKPIIAGIWPQETPILSVEDDEDVFNALCKLENPAEAVKIHADSKIFVEKYMSPLKLMNELFLLN